MAKEKQEKKPVEAEKVSALIPEKELDIKSKKLLSRWNILRKSQAEEIALLSK